ncbi:hypothetical protein KR222_000650, partial [Zaprionus bogoriensis]
LIYNGIVENIERPVKHDNSNSNSSDSDSSLSFEDANYEEGQSIDDAENTVPIYGPGRPRIERTGRPGRPSKIKNQLNVLQETEEVAVPEN